MDLPPPHRFLHLLFVLFVLLSLLHSPLPRLVHTSKLTITPGISGLADQQKSVNFTYVFGGSNGNEGLGLLSICLDWQYIAGSYNPMTIPLQAQVCFFAPFYYY